MRGHALRLADGLARVGQKLVEGELLGNGIVIERSEQIAIHAIWLIDGVQVGNRIAVVIFVQPCAIKGERNSGRAGVSASRDIEQRADHVERPIAEGQRYGIAFFFDEAGLCRDDGGGEFLLVSDLACCKAENIELLSSRGEHQILFSAEDVDYFRDAGERLRSVCFGADGDSECALVGPQGFEAVARVSSDADGEGVVVGAVAAVFDVCRCESNEVVLATH